MRNQSVQPDSRRRRPASTVKVPPLSKPQSDCETLESSPNDSVLLNPHRLEQEVRHRLMSEPQLNFTMLVVRRMQGGVCLEGVLETDDDSTDIEHLVRRVAGVEQVLNYLVVRHARELPRKG